LSVFSCPIRSGGSSGAYKRERVDSPSFLLRSLLFVWWCVLLAVGDRHAGREAERSTRWSRSREIDTLVEKQREEW